MIKKIILVIVLFLIVCLAINLYVVDNVHNYIVDNNDSEYILVLGASVKNNSPSLMLQERLDTAISLYDNNKIIVSGDGKDDDYDEVKVMQEYLLNHGVMEEDIICDDNGLSTYDSMNNLTVSKVTIVTQKYHLYRSLYIARRMGIDAYGVSATKVRYNGQTLRDIRECLAIIKDFFKVMIGGKR